MRAGEVAARAGSVIPRESCPDSACLMGRLLLRYTTADREGTPCNMSLGICETSRCHRTFHTLPSAATQCPDGCVSGDSNGTALCNDQAKCTGCVEGYALTDAGECVAVSANALSPKCSKQGRAQHCASQLCVAARLQHLPALQPGRPPPCRPCHPCHPSWV